MFGEKKQTRCHLCQTWYLEITQGSRRSRNPISDTMIHFVSLPSESTLQSHDRGQESPRAHTVKWWEWAERVWGSRQILSFQPQVLQNLERPSQEAVNLNSAWHSIILLNAAESSQSALATECQEQEAADTCNSKQWVLGEPQPL